VKNQSTDRRSTILLLAVIFLLSGAREVSGFEPTLRDAPIVCHEDDRRDIAKPKERDPNARWTMYNDTVARTRERWTDPVRITRKIGTLFGGDHVPPAANVNAVDEVPNSSWFTNRIALFPLSPDQAARGPGTGRGPDRSSKWTVIRAKSEGVSKGFRIRDAKGDIYLIKFDSPGFLGMTAGAGVISNRILYAAGYNVPDDVVVTFSRENLTLGEDVEIDHEETKRPMTEAVLDTLLQSVDRLPSGEWLALSSKFLSGEPLGPFDYQGRRQDDPNDHVKHEDRRELRGLYVLASWLNHYDTKQDNTLDMFVVENTNHFVKHHLIDLASTLGAGAIGSSQRSGYEYTADVPRIFRRAFTVGLLEDSWRKRTRPQDLPEVGYFVSDVYEPGGFRPHNPNPAFANRTERDLYWGAKIVVAFSDDHIRAIVAEARYLHREAEAYVARILMERRDKIARYYFRRTAPLDFFAADGEAVRFVDLAERYSVYPRTTPRYRVRCSVVNEDRQAHARTSWTALTGTSIALSSGPAAEALGSAPAEAYPFLAIELQVDRGDGWSPSVTVYRAHQSGRIVAIDR